jgi:phosphate transport system ATP-binding protein
MSGPASTGAARRLDVVDLSVSYHGRPALRRVTLPVRAGAITAIVGPSGCGKSTFLASLNRMTDLAAGCEVSGRILLDGCDLRDPGTDLVALRRRVGMIFQRPNPFPLSIRRNLTFPLEHHGRRDRAAREAEAEAALRRVGLWEEVQDRLDAPALKLSGGQQQRLCLARALALAPDVLLMDEPCSALDPIASGVVEDLVTSLRGQYTVVIATHNLAQARRVADDVAVFWLQDGAGTLIEHGPVGATFEAPRHELTAAYVRGIRG